MSKYIFHLANNIPHTYTKIGVRMLIPSHRILGTGKREDGLSAGVEQYVPEAMPKTGHTLGER